MYHPILTSIAGEAF